MKCGQIETLTLILIKSGLLGAIGLKHRSLPEYRIASLACGVIDNWHLLNESPSDHLPTTGVRSGTV